RTLDDDARVREHHRLFAVRAHLLEMAGDSEAARASYRQAARRTTSLPERRYLEVRAAQLEQGGARLASWGKLSADPVICHPVPGEADGFVFVDSRRCHHAHGPQSGVDRAVFMRGHVVARLAVSLQITGPGWAEEQLAFAPASGFLDAWSRPG